MLLVLGYARFDDYCDISFRLLCYLCQFFRTKAKRTEARISLPSFLLLFCDASTFPCQLCQSPPSSFPTLPHIRIYFAFYMLLSFRLVWGRFAPPVSVCLANSNPYKHIHTYTSTYKCEKMFVLSITSVYLCVLQIHWTIELDGPLGPLSTSSPLSMSPVQFNRK